jgi:hypothetical protein
MRAKEVSFILRPPVVGSYRLDPAGHVPAKWASKKEHGKRFIKRRAGYLQDFSKPFMRSQKEKDDQRVLPEIKFYIVHF